MRAMPRLSKSKTLGLDAEVEQTRTASGQRCGNGVAAVWWTVAEQAAAASRAAHLGGGGAGAHGARNQRLDRRRGDARRQLFACGPLARQLTPDLVPVAGLECGAHACGRIANPLEALENVAIPIEMPLGDLPIIGARVARRAGVGEDQPPFQLGRMD